MLRFTRDKLNAGYQARTDTHAYLVGMHGKGWMLRVFPLAETAGVKHTVGASMEDEAEADTKKLAVDIANRYDYLVTETDYGHLFVHTTPMRKALRDAYEADNERVRAEVGL